MVQRLKVLLLIFLAAISLAACGGQSAVLPTIVPTMTGNAADESDIAEESPRTADDGSSGIPATWTPRPIQESATSLPPPATRGPDESYVVQSGDTLAEIAASFGVDLDRLVAANNITDVDHIEVGQVLVIPR